MTPPDLDSNWIQNQETLFLNSFYTIITMVIMGFIFSYFIRK